MRILYTSLLLVMLSSVLVIVLINSNCDSLQDCFFYNIEMPRGDSNIDTFNEWILYYWAAERCRIASQDYWRLIFAILIIPRIRYFILYFTELLLLGIKLENEIGEMLPLVFWLSGIFGNIFSVLQGFNQIITGPGPSLMGLNGALFGEICFNERANQEASWVTLFIGLFLSYVNAMVDQGNWSMTIGCFAFGFYLILLYRVQPSTDNGECFSVDYNGYGVELSFKNYALRQIAIFFLALMFGYCLGAMKMMELNKPTCSSPSPPSIREERASF